MTQLCLRIPDKLGEALNLMARQKDRSKSYIATQAILMYLQEFADDEIDYKAASEAEKELKEGKSEIISWEELMQKLEINNDR